MPNSSPDTVLGADRFGDDSGRRFRFQYAYAAIVCCMLLDSEQDVIEVFCEHHEDILIKLKTGKYRGYQVKTRDNSQPVWKTSDDAVISSCSKFVKLDVDFPDHFESFSFLTNHPLHIASNGSSIPHVLEAIKNANSCAELTGSIAKFINSVSKFLNKAQEPRKDKDEDGQVLKRKSKDLEVHKFTNEEVFDALKKTNADCSLPKLADMMPRLVVTLTRVWTWADKCVQAQIYRAAQRLTGECGNASTLAHEDVLPGYLPATADPESFELKARIKGKRFDKDRVLLVLEQGLQAVEPLEGDVAMCPEPGSGDQDLLLTKLDAGGFSVVTQNSAVDLRNKADYLGRQWVLKFGGDKGLRRYDHVRSVVLKEAASAFEAKKNVGVKFGVEMLRDLRGRFESRRAGGADFHEASDDHLEGFAYSLTSQCKVQWSLETPWEES